MTYIRNYIKSTYPRIFHAAKPFFALAFHPTGKNTCSNADICLVLLIDVSDDNVYFVFLCKKRIEGFFALNASQRYLSLQH